MPESIHDAEDGFHEIQLSGKQLVFLAMATTVVLIFTFVCGVLVGRNVRADGERPDGAASVAAATGTQETTAEVAPPATEPPTPPVEDELTYHQRLQGSAPPETLKRPGADATPPAATPPPPAPAAEPQRSDTEKPAGASVPTSGRPGRWVIQVTALSHRSNAADIVKRLIGKGYSAFLLEPAAGAPRLYRIQIGRYDDRREAEAIVRRLRKEEGFSPEIKR